MSTDILDSPPAYSAENALKAETAMTDAFLTDEVQSALKINVGKSHRRTVLDPSVLIHALIIFVVNSPRRVHREDRFAQ